MKHFVPTFIPLLLAVVVFSGCDSGRVPGLVQYGGVVFFNGEPLADAMISFHPTCDNGRFGYAKTNDAGQFRATTIDPDDGLVRGQYRVQVAKFVVVRLIPRGDWEEAVAENQLPERYDSGDSPLTINVTGRTLDARFELTD